jgi:hypothetical protein
MVPSGFEESNTVLSKPDDMLHDDCECLSVLRTKDASGVPVVVSCWKPTQEEIDEITRTGRVWLVVLGHTMPPVSLCGQKPIES